MWPAAALRERGHDVHAVCQDGELEADIRPGDTVVVHVSNQFDSFAPSFRSLAATVHQLRREGGAAKVLLQWDDSHFDLGDIQPNTDGGWFTELIADHVEAAQDADGVIATTPYIAAKFRPFNRNVRVVPNYIASWVTELELPERLGANAVWVGHLGGIPGPEQGSAHGHDWAWATSDVARGAWPPVSLVGTVGAEAEWLASRGVNVAAKQPLIGDQRELYTAMAAGTCFGLAPVDPSLRFNLAKSWIKPLEYAALGMGSVASATPEYIRLTQQGRMDDEAPAVRETPAWFVRAAASGVRAWRHHARREDLRDYVREHLTVEANVGQWEEALDLA